MPKSSLLSVKGLRESLHECRDRIQKLQKLLDDPSLMSWHYQKQYLERCDRAEVELNVCIDFLQSDYSGSFLEWLREVHGSAEPCEYLKSQKTMKTDV
jgi:hypothetical protein